MDLSVANFLTQVKNIVTGGGRDTQGNARHDAGYLRVAEGVDLSSLTAPSGTIAAAQNTVLVPVGSMALVVNSQVYQQVIPYNFTVTAVRFRDDVAITTGAKAATFTAGIDGSAMTGGVIAIAGTLATGVATNGTSISALNSGTAGAKLSFTVSGVTAFVEGTGHIEATVTNLDLANALQGTADETNATVFKVPATVDVVGNVAWTVPPDYDEATDVLTVRVLASQVLSSTDNDVQLDAAVFKKVAGSALGSDINPTIPSTILSTTEQWLEFDLKGNLLKRDNVLYFNLITDGHNDTVGEEVLIHNIQFKYRSTLLSYHEKDTATPANLLR